MKFNRVSVLASVLLVIFAAVVPAFGDRVDDYVRAAIARQHVPGAAVAVVRDGKVVKAEGYGSSNLEIGSAAAPGTVFKIGSVSKQFIATGIMLLVDEGKVGLDDPVAKYLEGTPDAWGPITIRHLLTHTSGIVREAPGFDPLKVQADAEVIRTAYPLPLRFAPGEKWEYCNVGYFILAEVIRKSTGRPWSEFLDERVFRPLGMTSTRTTTTTAIVANRAAGYDWIDGRMENAMNYLALRPSGAFLSTVLDLAKWDAALDGDRILKPSARAQMWTPVKLNDGKTYPYGFGWELNPFGTRRVVRHGGSLPGFRAEFMRFPDDKLSVIVLTNGDDANPNLIAVNVADFYLPGLLPKRTAAKVDAKILDTLVGEYRVNPNVVVKVTREAGAGANLRVESPLGSFDLLPENETDFFTPDDRRATYRFIKNEKGKVTELALSLSETQNFRAKRVEK